MVNSYEHMLGKPMDPADHPAANLPLASNKPPMRNFDKDPWNYPFTGNYTNEKPYPQY